MKITLNEKTIDLGKGISHGGDVRAKLAPEQTGYQLYREPKAGGPDKPLTDTMRVFSGDKIYSVPPCHGA